MRILPTNGDGDYAAWPHTLIDDGDSLTAPRALNTERDIAEVAAFVTDLVADWDADRRVSSRLVFPID